MTIDVTITGVVFNAFGQRLTGAQTVSDDFGASLIQAKLATLATAGQFPLPQNTAFDASGATHVWSASDTLQSKHVGATIICTTALTITVPPGLPSLFSCIVIPPAAGNVTVTPTGNVQINGAQASPTRALAANPVGFSLAHSTSTLDSYLMGGS